MQLNEEKADLRVKDSDKAQDRRDLVRKLGKFALYAAPFTVLAATNKASAATGATGKGPGKHH